MTFRWTLPSPTCSASCKRGPRPLPTPRRPAASPPWMTNDGGQSTRPCCRKSSTQPATRWPSASEPPQALPTGLPTTPSTPTTSACRPSSAASPGSSAPPASRRNISGPEVATPTPARTGAHVVHSRLAALSPLARRPGRMRGFRRLVVWRYCERGPQGASSPRKGQSPPDRESTIMPPFLLRPRDADRWSSEGVAVPVVPLPAEPNLGQLRKQAKDLRRAVLAGDTGALAKVAEFHPGGLPDSTAADWFALRSAQLVIARRYGFGSWTRLKRHVEVIGRYSRFPDRMTPADPADPADAFLRLACLNYADDEPERWRQGRQLLIDHLEISDGNAYVAAAAADVGALQRILSDDPSAARREGGPYRIEPLFYLAYARHDPAVEAGAVTGAARLLLDAGGDPNAGYLWQGMLYPFTVLTGVFGEGELGPARQPRHPHSLALARVLLEDGADPNDA